MRFHDKAGKRRIAAMMGEVYPGEKNLDAASTLSALGEALGAEVGVFHTAHPDPGSVPIAHRHRCGRGVVVPRNPRILANDTLFWQEQYPDRVTAALEEFAAVLETPAGVLVQDARVHAACSYARYLLAWQPESVIAWHIGEHAAVGAFAARLIGCPFALVLPSVGGPMRDPSLAMALFAADLVVSRSAQLEVLAKSGVGSCALVSLDESAERVAAAVGSIGRPGELEQGAQAGFVGTPVPLVDQSASCGPFIILGAERTGSNMLSGLLAKQDDVAVAGELFNTRAIQERSIQWIRDAEHDEGFLDFLRWRSPLGLLQRLVTDAESCGKQRVGMKFLHTHGLANDRAVRAMLSVPSLRVINLYRENRVQRWVSFCRARANDSWYLTKGSKRSRPPAITLQPREMLAGMTLDECLDERFSAVFEDHPSLRISYEEMMAGRAQSLHSIGALLGRQFRDVEAVSKKQGSSRLGDVVANVSELQEAFRGTRFEEQIA